MQFIWAQKCRRILRDSIRFAPAPWMLECLPVVDLCLFEATKSFHVPELDDGEIAEFSWKFMEQPLYFTTSHDNSHRFFMIFLNKKNNPWAMGFSTLQGHGPPWPPFSPRYGAGTAVAPLVGGRWHRRLSGRPAVPGAGTGKMLGVAGMTKLGFFMNMTIINGAKRCETIRNDHNGSCWDDGMNS